MPTRAVEYSGAMPLRRVVPPRIVGPPLNACSLACLRLASPHESIDTWRAELDIVCARYSQRSVMVRLDDLHARGYLTTGCPRHGFLSEK